MAGGAELEEGQQEKDFMCKKCRQQKSVVKLR
jgi:hypothetical protein